LAGPRVLHQPVVTKVFIRSITHSQDTVVDLVTTVFKDSTSVELQGAVNGDSDGDGLDVKDSLHLSGLALRNHFPATNSVGTVVLLALALETLVGVIGLKRNSVLFDKFEGINYGTSVAAVVFSGAVHQGLFGEFDKVTGFNRVETLQGTCGGESPARAALALVFHRGDDVVLSPVDFVLLGFVADDAGSVGGNMRVDTGLEHGEFVEREVHEFIVAQSVGKVLGIDFIDEAVVLLENSKATILFVRTVFLVEFDLPGLELGHQGVDLRAGEVRATGQQRSKHSDES
jgi:hypothetical protein